METPRCSSWQERSNQAAGYSATAVLAGFTTNIALNGSSPHSEPVAPGVLRWSRLRMCQQEMMQDMEQGQHMLLVSAPLRLSNIVNDHMSNFLAAVLAR
jgi:hypothetical protein